MWALEGSSSLNSTFYCGRNLSVEGGWLPITELRRRLTALSSVSLQRLLPEAARSGLCHLCLINGSWPESHPYVRRQQGWQENKLRVVPFGPSPNQKDGLGIMYCVGVKAWGRSQDGAPEACDQQGKIDVFTCPYWCILLSLSFFCLLALQENSVTLR